MSAKRSNRQNRPGGVAAQAPPETDAPETEPITEPATELEAVLEPEPDRTPEIKTPTAGKQPEVRKVQTMPKPAPEKKLPPYSIAEGRSVTSKKGVLGPGDEVRPEWLGGGQKAFDSLLDKKFFIDNTKVR